MPGFLTGISCGNCSCVPTVATTEALTVDQHDMAILTVGGQPADVVRLNVTSPIDITGLISTTTGQEVTFVNVGTATATIRHQNAGSIITNRIITPTEGDLALEVGQTLTVQKDEATATARFRVTGGTATGYDTTVATRTVTGDTNDLDLATSTGGGAPNQRWDVQNASIITGITAPTGVTTCTITNVGDSVAYFPNESGSSSANNQFLTPGGVTLALVPGATFAFVKGPGGEKWIPISGTGVSAPGVIAFQPVIAPGTPAVGAVMYVDAADAVLKAKDSAGAITLLDGSAGTQYVGWEKVTFAYTALVENDNHQSTAIYSLPAGAALMAVALRPTTLFANPGITFTALEASIGIAGDEPRYLNPLDVSDEGAATTDGSYFAQNFGTNLPEVRHFASATSILLTMETDGSITLDTMTAGALDVWLLVSTLP